MSVWRGLDVGSGCKALTNAARQDAAVVLSMGGSGISTSTVVENRSLTYVDGSHACHD